MYVKEILLAGKNIFHLKKSIFGAQNGPARLMIAEIKRSKFLIADFSGLRSGVFFEAGFAKGLGREVIFTVRKKDVGKLKKHFDTRQYNHIVYDSHEDLRKKLYNRIGATNAAIDAEIITKNPFRGQAVSVQANESRFFYVTSEMAQKVLEACPDA